MTLAPHFTALDWFPAAHNARRALVHLDRPTMDFEHLKGGIVMVDGAMYRCLGVETCSRVRPWLKNEPVGLLLREVDALDIEMDREIS